MRSIRRFSTGVCLIALVLVLAMLGACQPAPATPKDTVLEVTYNGVKGYGSVDADDKDTFEYCFSDGSNQYVFAMDNRVDDPVTGEPYALQNLLQRNARYRITVKDGVVTALESLDPTGTVDLTTPVTATAGEKTVKNLLATAMMPVGRTLYIYGGGWNWQDNGASREARSIGLAESWVQFFDSQTMNFQYRNNDASNTYYPYGAWNEYYYAGLDCSGYVGWVLYNVIQTTDGQAGYVMGANKMAKTFASYNWGQFLRNEITPGDGQLLPGDIISKPGHVWICVGTCDDGSVVFLHASPTDSRAGEPGGGVQLSVLGEDTNCQAYQLADHYMKTYYPQWYQRYPVALKDFAEYTAFAGNSVLGRFTWDVSGHHLMTDPDGVRDMSAAQVLALLFGEAQ